MPEISVASLPARLQRQVTHARTAIDRGNTEYAISICRGILREHPGCLAVRRLLRAAQLKLYKEKNPLLARAVGVILGTPAVATARAMLKNHPARAMDAAERALSAYPLNVAALRIVAAGAMALELPETAVFVLEAAREISPDNRAIRIELVRAYTANGQADEAVRIADRLLSEDPSNPELQELVKRASVARSIRAGHWDAASGSYRDSLRDEDRADVIEQTNKLVASAEATRRIIEEARRRVEIEPLNLNNYRTIIEGYRRLGELENALEWVGRARAIPVGSVDANLERAEVDLRIELAEKRVAEREKAVRAEGGDPDRDDETRRLRAALSDLRIDNLEALTRKYPNELGYRYELGRLYLEASRVDEAIQQFQLSQRSPKFRVSSLAALAESFMAKGLFDLAAEQLEIARSELAGFDAQKKEIIYQLGCCYEKLGQQEKALKEFKQIYSVDIGFRDVAAKIDAFYSKG
ncbi:MAG: tetratricopeptide repeat protein [Verrucomicrobia bacterium]|nr:MAG: tetratricopeptide repeat protein [Verrucomicrobiota bacterium]